MRVFLLFLLFVSLRVFGEPVGNPSSPNLLEKGFFIPRTSSIDVRAGYLGNFIFDRRLEQHKEGFGRVDNFQIYANSGIVTINVKDRWDIYGSAGAGKIEADWRVNTNGVLTRVVSCSEDELAWTVGTNILLLEWGPITLGVGGSYTELNPSLNSLTIDGVSMDVAGTSYCYKEWQANLAFSYEVSFLIPYIGFKYSEVDASIQSPMISGLSSDGSGNNHFRSRDLVGLYLGCTITTRSYFLINIEARLIDEEAVSVLAEFRF